MRYRQQPRRLVAGFLAALAAGAGCDTARPGAGLTNGPGSTTTDNPAIRTDLGPAPAPDRGEAANTVPAFEEGNAPGTLPGPPAEDTPR